MVQLKIARLRASTGLFILTVASLLLRWKIIAMDWESSSSDDRHKMHSLTQIGEIASDLSILEVLDVGTGTVYKAEDISPLLRHPEILTWRS